MDYCFRLTPYDRAALTPQLALALEKRTEALSRAKMPRLWARIDRLNEKHRGADKKAIRKARIRFRIYGILLLLLGLFLLIPGLLSPKELFVPMLIGIIAVLSGVFYLWIGRNQTNARYARAADKLLSSAENVPAAEVRFTPEGMTPDGGQTAAYSDFDFLIETDDLFVFTWSGHLTVLQKKDLISGDAAAFLVRIAECAPQAKRFCLASDSL